MYFSYRMSAFSMGWDISLPKTYSLTVAKMLFCVSNLEQTNFYTKWLRITFYENHYQRRYYLQQGITHHSKTILSCFVDQLCCSVVQSCLTLCDRMDCSTPGFPVLHYYPKFAQTHVHQVSDAIQPSSPLSSPSPPAFTLSQHRGLFQWVSSSHQVAKVLELQHQSF